MDAAAYLVREEQEARARLAATGRGWRASADSVVRRHPLVSTAAGFCAGLGTGWLAAPAWFGRRGLLSSLASTAASIAKMSLVRWAVDPGALGASD